MDLTKLPEEMLEEIAQYLSLEDICSCSKVSKQWKIAFNSNRIWKRFDSFSPWYIDNQCSKLNYKTDDRTREDCDRKERALKVKFVEENMLNGNYIVEEINIDTLYCDGVLDFVDSVGNHWLFVSCMDGNVFEGEHRIQVWNLNDKPLFHSSTSTCVNGHNRLIDSQMNFIEETFYFINSTTLLVYKFACPMYVLEHVQTFSLDPSIVYGNVFSRDLSTLNRCVGNTVVNFFRNSYRVLNKIPPSFIAWNRKSCVLLKDNSYVPVLLDPYYYSIYNFSVGASISEKALVPVAYLSYENNIEILSVKIFDVELLCYTDFYLEKRVKSGLHELSLHKKTLCFMYYDMNGKLAAECHNIEDKTMLFNVSFSTSRINYFHKLFSDAELIIFENKVVHLFNILKKKEINSFKIGGHDFGALTVLNETLILMECVTRRTIGQEIWNFRTGQKLYTINFSMSLGVQQFRYSHSFSCPPTIIMFKNPQMSYAHLNVQKNLVYIIHFW